MIQLQIKYSFQNSNIAGFIDSFSWCRIGDIIGDLLFSNAYRGTKYMNETEVINVRRYRSTNNRKQPTEFIVTIGKPNDRERKFIQRCKKERQRFPVPIVQLQFK